MQLRVRGALTGTRQLSLGRRLSRRKFHPLLDLRRSPVASPTEDQDGVILGRGQWNLCNPSTYDWPWFHDSPADTDDSITIEYITGASTLGACGAFDYTRNILTIWDFYDANGTIVNCTHSDRAISDTVAHELGHYLGLGHTLNCPTSIMGPTRTDPNGLLKTDYQISATEKDRVDDDNSTEQEDLEEQCGGDPNCGGQTGGGGGGQRTFPHPARPRPKWLPLHLHRRWSRVRHQRRFLARAGCVNITRLRRRISLPGIAHRVDTDKRPTFVRGCQEEPLDGREVRTRI